MRILDDTGYPIHPDIGNRKALLRKMGDLIPKLQIRQRRVAMETAQGPASDPEKCVVPSQRVSAVYG